MRNYWHVWYVLSYDSIRATIRHIIFSVCPIKKGSMAHLMHNLFLKKSLIPFLFGDFFEPKNTQCFQLIIKRRNG
jgi:hypothetical protein